MRFISLCLLCVLITSACQTSAPPTPINVPGSGSVSVSGANSVVQWIRSPEVIVFRADLAGGERQGTLVGQRDVAWCTVYGDNRVVWVNELGASEIEILYDRISDDVLANFVATLTINERIYTYSALAPTVEPGVTDAASALPVYETILINVNGLEHRADGFSGWAPDLFARVADRCKSLSQAPVLFEPSAGWLSAEPAEYNPEIPVFAWNESFGIDLATLVTSDSPRWIMTGAGYLWNLQNRQPSNFVVQQGDNYYRIALQVPGISRISPPPP